MRTHALRSLALHGLDHLDAVVVAALASEEPLLLVGPHGSAKSALLNRIAAALGLEHRHYNVGAVFHAMRHIWAAPLPTEPRCESSPCRPAWLRVAPCSAGKSAGP